MKTKNILLTGSFVLAAFGVTSCSLDTESKTSLNEKSAYSSLESAEMDLIGCYDGWQCTQSSAGAGIYLISEFASDQAHAGLGLSDARNYSAIDQFDISLAPSYTSLFETEWTLYYATIFRCNKIIANEDVTDWGTEKDKGRVLGETRAIRAICYFDLARLFGDVPLLLTPVNENIARTPAKDVYKQIFEDFKYAAENIPADAYPVENRNSNDGRISKYAAEALMARAYLYYTGYYGEENEGCTKQEAIDALQDVINNGGYELEENYADLFMPACTEDASSGGTYAWNSTYKGKYCKSVGVWTGDISKEVILNLKFNTTQDYNGNADGNTFQVYLGPRNNSATSMLIASGWGACSVTKEFVNTFGGDPRFSTCCWSCADATGFEPDVEDTYEYTGYYTRKYAPMCFSDGTRQEAGLQLGEKHQNITYYQDWTIMRYADVLLMQAELTQDAKYLNEVHKRAWGAAGGTLTYSEENLRNERAIEFAFEGVHYWDLMRYEKDGAYAAKAIYEAQNGATVQNGGIETTTTFNMDNFNKKKGLMQIPNDEITLSGGVLTQNAGW